MHFLKVHALNAKIKSGTLRVIFVVLSFCLGHRLIEE